MNNTYDVFVYGTLRKPEVLQTVLHRMPAMSPDSLEDFRRGYMQIGSNRYFVADPNPGTTIRGYVLQNITQQELTLLDEYETAAYTRRLVTLQSGTNAWLYCRNSQGL